MAVLESIGKVINYERHITIKKDDTMDDYTFFSLQVLKVPDIRTQSIDASINNDDTNDTILEDSTVTKDYGVTKQVHRSGSRHSSSIGGYTLKTLHTADFVIDKTDSNTIDHCSLIVGIQLKIPSTTCKKQNKIDSVNAFDDRKTPKIVNVHTINVPTVK